MTTSDASSRHALIVGASRGLGLGFAEGYLERGWHVTGTVRAGARTKLHELRERWPSQLEIETVDMTVSDEVAMLRSRLEGKNLDVLLINAGVANDMSETIADVATDEFVRIMVTNALSPLRLIEALDDVVDPNGTIAVVSSGQGSITNNLSGANDVYRASKAALNMLMRSYAARHASEQKTLLLLAPGWIRTDMGGSAATFSLEESIPVLVDTIEAQRGKPGLQYLDRQGRTVPW